MDTTWQSTTAAPSAQGLQPPAEWRTAIGAMDTDEAEEEELEDNDEFEDDEDEPTGGDDDDDDDDDGDDDDEEEDEEEEYDGEEGEDAEEEEGDIPTDAEELREYVDKLKAKIVLQRQVIIGSKNKKDHLAPKCKEVQAQAR